MEIFTFRIDSRFRAHLERSSTERARRETYLRAKRDEKNPGKAFDIVVLNSSLRDWCWLRPFPIAWEQIGELERPAAWNINAWLAQIDGRKPFGVVATVVMNDSSIVALSLVVRPRWAGRSI